jgi:methylated-DNA-[protein]-cysteine S-methyltransferase
MTKLPSKSEIIKSSSFRSKVLEIVSKIPKGKIMTYKQVAILAGNPLASRAVGAIMNKNRSPQVPCHRIVSSDGWLRGFAWGLNKKKEILQQEGIEITGYTIKDLKKFMA